VIKKFLKPFQEVGYNFDDTTTHDQLSFLAKAYMYINNNKILAEKARIKALQTLII